MSKHKVQFSLKLFLTDSESIGIILLTAQVIYPVVIFVFSIKESGHFL